MPPILVLYRIHRNGLEAAPAYGEGEGIPRLQDLREPAVAFESELQASPALLNCGQPSHQQWLFWTEVLDQLTRDACPFQAPSQTPEMLK